jgi:hypothetical protein
MTTPAQIYADKVRAFLRDAGLRSGEYPVLRKDEHPDEWLLWKAYYRHNGLAGSLALMGDRTEKTVPALSPRDFDLEGCPEFGKPSRQRALSAYRPPRSAVLERRCTKDFARQLVANRVHPRGSIWCPGGVNDHPEYGDLYGPDPDWKPPVSLDGPAEAQAAFVEDKSGAKQRVQRLLAETGHRIWRDGRLAEAKAPEPLEPPPPRTVPDYSQDKIEIGAALKKQLGIADEPNPKQPDDFGGIS